MILTTKLTHYPLRERPLRELSREQLEALVDAHRAEFIESFRDTLDDDERLALKCLADFEEEPLAREDLGA